MSRGNVYKLCLEIQDASNFGPVVRAFGQAISELQDEQSWLQTHGINVDLRRHPVSIWFQSKLHEMTTNGEPHSGVFMEALQSISYPTLAYLAKLDMRSQEHLDGFKEYAVGLTRFMEGDSSVQYTPPNTDDFVL